MLFKIRLRCGSKYNVWAIDYRFNKNAFDAVNHSRQRSVRAAVWSIQAKQLRLTGMKNM